jgi:hypothetical protein
MVGLYNCLRIPIYLSIFFIVVYLSPFFVLEPELKCIMCGNKNQVLNGKSHYSYFSATKHTKLNLKHCIVSTKVMLKKADCRQHSADDKTTLCCWQELK